MEPVGLFEMAANAGVSVLLAIVVIYWYRADTQKRIEESKVRESDARAWAEREREDKMMLINVLNQHIEVQSKLVQMIDELRGEFRRYFSGQKREGGARG